MHPMDNEVATILQRCLGGGPWQVRKPQAGQAKETFLGTHEGRTVFVKFDANPAVVRRVAELGITHRPPAARE